MIARTFHIGNSRQKLMRILSTLSALLVTEQDDLEIELRTRRKEKSHQQRKLFHGLCTEAGKELGLTKAAVKEIVKEEHFGRDRFIAPNGKVYDILPSSEESDRYDYSALIETLLRWAAENGVPLDTRIAA